MRLPRWFRHFASHVGVLSSDEVKGELCDYNNGEWVKLHQWKAGEKSPALVLVKNMLDGNRDAIYVASMQHTNACGVFQVIDSNHKVYQRFWAIGCYEPQEAFVDVVKYLHDRAKQMGWAEHWQTESQQHAEQSDE